MSEVPARRLHAGRCVRSSLASEGVVAAAAAAGGEEEGLRQGAAVGGGEDGEDSQQAAGASWSHASYFSLCSCLCAVW